MLFCALAFGWVTPSASGQSNEVASPGRDESSISGTVVSSSANTLVVKIAAGNYAVFIFDRYTIKPAAIATGSTVRVSSTPSADPGVRVATDIVVSAPPAAQPAADTEPVPLSVRRLESDIKRQSRRYGLGVRLGAGLDPEVLTVGVQARLGPFFDRNLSFRPNVEFAFGEVTKLFAFNPEGVYRLPLTPRQGSWSAYVGAGPGFSLIHQNFQRAAAGDTGIDFGDLNFKAGLNFLTGIELRSGVFFEAKTTLYAEPHLRLIVGYTF